jgi:glycosyltransferase involved in cell wall biosynthesis
LNIHPLNRRGAKESRRLSIDTFRETTARMQGKKVSVIIPVYNEENSIGKVVESVFQTLGGDVQVVIVDDGSTDKSAMAAREKGALVIQHPYNMGNGAAIKTGIRNAAGDILVFLYADGKQRPE